MLARLREPAVRNATLLVVGLLLFLTASYWGTFTGLAHRWNSDPNYSHGYLVPLVSLYLAFQVRAQQTPPERVENSDGDAHPANGKHVALRGGLFFGTLILALGLLVRYATVLVPSTIVESLSLLLVLSGLVLLIGGWEWAKRLWAPVAFLSFMIPWPSAIYSRIAFPLQLFVSQTAAVILQVLGIPVLRDGNLIHLPGQTMHVAEACSGLRQLTAFLAICACAALLMPRPRWYRVLLLCSSIPIAVLINILRVTITGLMLNAGLREWTEGSLHTAEGMIMVGLGLGALMLETKLLDWLLEGETPPESSTQGGQT